MNFVLPGKVRHHREFAKNVRQRFRIAGAGGGFAVVLGKFQGVRQQESVETIRESAYALLAIIDEILDCCRARCSSALVKRCAHLVIRYATI